MVKQRRSSVSRSSHVALPGTSGIRFVLAGRASAEDTRGLYIGAASTVIIIGREARVYITVNAKGRGAGRDRERECARVVYARKRAWEADLREFASLIDRPFSRLVVHHAIPRSVKSTASRRLSEIAFESAGNCINQIYTGRLSFVGNADGGRFRSSLPLNHRDFAVSLDVRL